MILEQISSWFGDCSPDKITMIKRLTSSQSSQVRRHFYQTNYQMHWNIDSDNISVLLSLSLTHFVDSDIVFSIKIFDPTYYWY